MMETLINSYVEGYITAENIEERDKIKKNGKNANNRSEMEKKS